ncbi:WD domain-containing protein, G-beta repeat-containing protein [Neorhodopirellula lusitana]|uniref:WD domain-containing protein, G-beta repeat-containing protein n=1 Tax=Neorhodopirellula lusitana TaxID=445327 RepID=A0ABY1QNV1_9BACT|nr:caspase family protein [Neorhodopirellula lusitana]SMP76524.1 WD domain-containing protein, G-beta repeat-containing protein [Neorhodopirellula lusitana]
MRAVIARGVTARGVTARGVIGCSVLECSVMGLAIALVGYLPITVAQDIPPRVVLNTGGPTSQIRQMAFSPDSQRLYVAGLDKVVHHYEVGWDVRATDEPPAITLASPLHWEQARGNRGSLYAMALAGTRPEMVIGGVSARQETGDIAIFDVGQGRVTGSLPTPAQRAVAVKANQVGSEGHRFSVMCLDYSPDGNAIVSRDEYGGMFLWERNSQGGFATKRLRDPGPTPRKHRPQAIIVDGGNLVYSKAEDGGEARLVIQSLASGREATFSESYHGRVAALARDPNGKYWASADARGTVYLSDATNPANRHRVQAGLPKVTAIALGGQGSGNPELGGQVAADHVAALNSQTMAVLSSEFIDGQAGQTIVEVFDVHSRERLDRLVVSNVDPCLAVAISPDGRFLSVGRESPRQVVVFRLVDETGNRVPQPLKESSAATTQASVRPCGFIALSPDESQLAFGPRLSEMQGAGDLKRAWDLKRGELIEGELARVDWKLPIVQPVGWQVRRQGQPMDQLVLEDPRGSRWQIDLERGRQGSYSSHCFLFAENEAEPVGIAVGTENINSIFVYRFEVDPGAGFNAKLPSTAQSQEAAQRPKLVRWFRDHTGPVTSLIANEDGTVLYSGSLDHTIKIWRLNGLFDSNDPGVFQNASHWGCGFVIEQGSVVVRDVDRSGIAFARSLREGDRIDRIQGYAGDDPSQIIDAVAGRESAQQMLDVLGRVSILNQNLIHASPRPDPGQAGEVKTKKFIIRPAWLPLLTAFANQQGEWVIWHPEGVFDASAAEGGILFDWMILRGPDRSPRMMKAGFLAKEFERPEVIRQLLIGAVLEELVVQSVSGQSLASVIRATPDIRIVQPLVGEHINSKEKTSIVAEIDFGDADVNAYRVSGNIDAVRLGEPQRQSVGQNRYQYSWDAVATGRLNQIEVIARENGGVMTSLYASDVAYRRGETDNPTPYQLHFLSLASENYRGPIATQRGGFGELKFPIDDVEAIVATLNEKQAAGLSRYRLGSIRQLRDEQITKASVNEAIADVNQELRRQSDHQILIVYLSGHGTTVDGQYHYVTTTSRSTAPAALKKSSLPWSLIERAGVPGCRIIYMIDTCHSGSVVDAKSSIREPLRSGGIVIAAASGRGAAQELTPLQHGCFTFSVLSALEGEADGALGTNKATKSAASTAPNGVVELEELVAFVRSDVRKLTGGQQKPTATPSRLADHLNIDLVVTAP